MLNKEGLKQDIKKIYKKAQKETDDADKVLEMLASGLADAIEKFVKNATVTVAAGIPVATAGTAAAQTGATTATGTGQIS